MMIKKLLSRNRDERGQALVEFAFVLMAFMLFIFGIVEGARLFQSWITVQHASREAARWGITGQVNCDEAVGDRLACIQATAAKNLTTLMDSDTATVEVNHYAFPDYNDPPIAGDAGGPCDLLEVQIEYDHTVVVPIIGAITGNTIGLSTEERMVNEPFGAC